MPHPDQTFHKIESLSAVERKEYEELKDYHSAYQRKRREKIVFYGYCIVAILSTCLLYTSPSPRDRQKSRMPSSA